ncbi:secreted RxLR effector protein 161-like [Belonocnema kinseyi]|uniref:secreted RxLR effector protein 161-like n=1 Tax=Belonocnema kinseyi TaxID=2817044 RepID=UPI00143D66F8|nr:secreted RxLR effector protein 161-like [Belonocnema kinseyi]
MYIAIETRPDIAHAVVMLSQFNSYNGKTHWQCAKMILRYLQGTINRKLIYTKEDEGILGHADADWGSCTYDRKFYSGCVFSLSGAAISWTSRKQRIVALSSTEAEYGSLYEAVREAIHFSSFVKELRLDTLSQITIFNDNRSAGKLDENPVFHARTKHMDIKHHFIRQAIQAYPLIIKFLPTEEMTADILTKPLSGIKFDNCVSGLGLKDC